MLRIENLCYEYESGFKLKNISFEVRDGESIAIIGENGSGKTTLVKNLIGLLRPDSGKIFLNGEDTSKMSVAEIARTIGFVFQNPDNQIFASSVKEEVSFGPKNLGMENIEEKVNDVLKKTDLFKYRDKHPFKLSGGEKQRLALASILVMNPKILILDEPTSGLDVINAQEIRNIIKSTVKRGTTVLLSSHNMLEVEFLCSNIALINEGKIVEEGRPSELKEKYDADNIEDVFTEVIK